MDQREKASIPNNIGRTCTEKYTWFKLFHVLLAANERTRAAVLLLGSTKGGITIGTATKVFYTHCTHSNCLCWVFRQSHRTVKSVAGEHQRDDNAAFCAFQHLCNVDWTIGRNWWFKQFAGCLSHGWYWISPKTHGKEKSNQKGRGRRRQRDEGRNKGGCKSGRFTGINGTPQNTGKWTPSICWSFGLFWNWFHFG